MHDGPVLSYGIDALCSTFRTCRSRSSLIVTPMTVIPPHLATKRITMNQPVEEREQFAASYSCKNRIDPLECRKRGNQEYDGEEDKESNHPKNELGIAGVSYRHRPDHQGYEKANTGHIESADQPDHTSSGLHTTHHQ